MKYINFPVVLFVTVIALSCKSDSGPSERADSPELGFQPNILWVTCEDITPALGCYGDEAANTPNLDRLASEGLIYTHAFSVHGVCAPSRHALITGMYPTSTGGNHMRTLNVKSPDLRAYSVMLPEGVKCFSEYLRAAGYYCTNNKKTDYQFTPPITAWDENGKSAHWKNRNPGQPFFAVFNLEVSHESRIWLKKDDSLWIDPERVPIPPYYPEHPVVRQDVARKYSNIAEMDFQFGQILAELENAGLLDSTIVFFYSDHGGPLPREKRELYDTGLRVPLIIRFPGKHLAGSKISELVSFVDFGPTVLSLTDVDIPAHMQGQAFLGKQKSDPRAYIYAARDRIDEDYDRVRAVRDKQFKYLFNYYPELPYVMDIGYRKQIPMMSVLYEYDSLDLFRGNDSLWWRINKPVEELYDTEKDPFEFNNLAGDPAYAAKMEEMRGALKEWQSAYGDMGDIPEREMIDRWWQNEEAPPKTEKVEGTWRDGSLVLHCPTPGASIAWQDYSGQIPEDKPLAADGTWNLYTSPITLNGQKKIRTVAIRIGFTQSEVSVFSPEP